MIHDIALEVAKTIFAHKTPSLAWGDFALNILTELHDAAADR